MLQPPIINHVKEDNKNMRTRSKIIVISVIILVVSIIFAVIIQYFAQKRQKEELSEPLNQVTSQSFLGTQDNDQIKTIIEETIQFPSFDINYNDLYYFNYQVEKLYKSNLDNKKSITILPYQNFEGGLSNMQFDLSYTKVLVSSNLDENKKIYDLEKDSPANLNRNFINLIWLTKNQLLANVHDYETNENSLAMLDEEGKIIDTIINLQSTEMPYGINFLGSDKEKVFYIFNSTLGHGSLYELNVSSKTNEQLTEKNIISAKLSPNKEKIIYSSLENEKLNYYLLDLKSNESKALTIDINIENIIFSNDSNYLYLIYGTPGNEEGSKAYSYYFIDKINKYNFTDNNQTTVVDITEKEKYAGSDFFLNSDESLLYFVNAANSYLYSIKLK